MVLGYLTVGALMVSAAWFSIARIETEIETTSQLHENAYGSLTEIKAGAVDAARQLFGYLVAGNSQDLTEFRAAVDVITTESERYASRARLSEIGREDDLEQFTALQAAWATCLSRAESIIVEFDETGSVSRDSFDDTERVLNAFTAQVDAMLADRAIRVGSSRARRDQSLHDSRDLLGVVAGVGLLALVAVGFLVTRTVTGYVNRLKQRDEDLELRRTALDNTHVGICYMDATNGNAIVYVNEAMSDITGYTRQELIGASLGIFNGEHTAPADAAAFTEAMAAGVHINLVIRHHDKNGTPFWNALFVAPVRDVDDTLTHFVAAMHDVSERRNLENQLVRAQKMEAVGQLAGGIAHDFNNYLTVINGTAETIALQSTDEQIREQANQIVAAGSRSAELTRHLLAFSGRQMMVPQILDLNQVIEELDPLLRRTLGEQVSLDIAAAPGLGMVNTDQSQIEQVLLNLVVNARDAMPAGGGRITIETGNHTMESNDASHVRDDSQSTHVRIAVSDTGNGIPAAIRDRIFDPYFSTKDAGGSGLGLSTVLGIVDQNGGTVKVASEEGAGSTFTLYLPRVAGEATSKPADPVDSVADLSGRVLVVEDDDLVREITSQMLRGLGLEVREAPDGQTALEILGRHHDDIDLLLSDVMLPGMSGNELADKAVKSFPALRVMFMSGYAENGIANQDPLADGVKLLEKPFTMNELKRKLSMALGNVASSS